jgi:hypothetical protein
LSVSGCCTVCTQDRQPRHPRSNARKLPPGPYLVSGSATPTQHPGSRRKSYAEILAPCSSNLSSTVGTQLDMGLERNCSYKRFLLGWFLWRFSSPFLFTMMSPESNLSPHLASRPRALDCPSTSAALAKQTAESLLYSVNELGERHVYVREYFETNIASSTWTHLHLSSSTNLPPPPNASTTPDRRSNSDVILRQRRPSTTNAGLTPRERLASARAALLRHKKQLAATGNREAWTRPPARQWLFRGLFPEQSLPPGFQPELAAIQVSRSKVLFLLFFFFLNYLL